MLLAAYFYFCLAGSVSLMIGLAIDSIVSMISEVAMAYKDDFYETS